MTIVGLNLSYRLLWGFPDNASENCPLGYCRTSENYTHETYHGGERIVIVHDARSNYSLPFLLRCVQLFYP